MMVSITNEHEEAIIRSSLLGLLIHFLRRLSYNEFIGILSQGVVKNEHDDLNFIDRRELLASR